MPHSACRRSGRSVPSYAVPPYTPTPYNYRMKDLLSGGKWSEGFLRALLRIEAIADAAHCSEKDWIGRIVLDITAQAHDEVVDGARVRVLAHAPHLLQQLLARNAAPLMPHQVAQQVSLHDGEANAAALFVVLIGVVLVRVVLVWDAQLECGEVDGAPGKGIRRLYSRGHVGIVLPPLPRPAPQQAVQARQQDRQIEGLGQVVVGADGESSQHILGAAPRGQDQDRCAVLALAQLLHHGETVAAGQHHVHYHDVDGSVGGGSDLERCFTVARNAGAVALRFQVEFQALCQMIFVLDDEDMGRGAHTVAPRSNLPPGVRMRGSCRWMVEPRPSPGLSAKASPPC